MITFSKMSGYGHSLSNLTIDLISTILKRYEKHFWSYHSFQFSYMFIDDRIWILYDLPPLERKKCSWSTDCRFAGAETGTL